MIYRGAHRWLGLVAGFWFGLIGPSARAAELVWVELLTNGIPAEMAPFYERTLGWSSERTGPGARDAVVLSRNGRPVAAVTYRAGERMEGLRGRWLPFFAHEGAAELGREAAGRPGGGLVEASHGGAGPASGARLWADAEGAVFGLVSRREGGVEPARGFWPVLLAREPAMAARFYHELLGLEVRDETRTPMFAFDFVLRAQGRDLAGVQPTGVSGGAGWMVLIGVADIDAVTRAARRAGGRVLREPTIDLIGGRVAIIADPVGAVFGLYESLPLGAPVRSGAVAAETFEVEVIR